METVSRSGLLLWLLLWDRTALKSVWSGPVRPVYYHEKGDSR